jgi:molybdopterin synthase sulfur carrier subunit
MNIRIRYFASLREITGQSQEVLALTEGASISEVRALLVERFPRLQSILERCVYAVNRGYVPADTALHEGDELVFIPPMGGGASRGRGVVDGAFDSTDARATG